MGRLEKIRAAVPDDEKRRIVLLAWSYRMKCGGTIPGLELKWLKHHKIACGQYAGGAPVGLATAGTRAFEYAEALRQHTPGAHWDTTLEEIERRYVDAERI